MKKEKRNLIIIICGGIALFFFLLSFIMIVNKYEKIKKEYQVLKNEDSNRTYTCSLKDNSLETYDYEQKITFQVNKDSEVINTTTEFIFTYRQKEPYDFAKNDIDFGEYQVNFDDENYHITQIDKKEKMVDNNGEEIHIWFKNYLSSLEQLNYQCMENEKNK